MLSSILHYICKIKTCNPPYFHNFICPQNSLINSDLYSCYIKMNLEQRQSYLNTDTACKTYFDSFATSIRLEEMYQTSTIQILKTQNLISMLESKVPHDRTQKDNKIISDLLKHQSYFASISRNPKMLLEISSWIQYRKVQIGGFVYKIGEASECFYIVLKGEIQLSYPEKVVQNDPTEGEIQESYSPLLRKMLTQPPSNSPSIEKALKQISESQIKRVSKKLNLKDQLITVPSLSTPQKPKFEIEQRIVRIVCQGQSFGDLGTTGRRGTNAIAKQTSHLLIIRRQYYAQISKAQLKSDGKLKFQFLNNLQFFKLVHRYALQSVLYFLQQHKVSYNNIIYNEDDLVKYVYIIYKGQFKLYKKVMCKKKQKQSQPTKEENLQIQQTRHPQRNISFKGIQIGEILGHLELFHQNSYHLETCVCKSQEGVILKVQKSKFMKKILSSDHNMEELMSFVKMKYQTKLQELQQFVHKHQNNEMYVRYLHTPSARSRKIKTESAAEIQREEKKQELRRLSSAHDNFFNKINQTVVHHPKSRRISLNRTSKVNESLVKNVPSSVKDIVQMVKHQLNYQNLRKPQKDVTLFQFNISKVPLHVKKKYDFLFKNPNK